MKELNLTFAFDSNAIRVLGTFEEPSFVAIDVCKALAYSNPHKAIQDNVEPDDLTTSEVIDAVGRKQKTILLNESGLYQLILRSNKPEAKQFQRWVTREVLPSIRKTGSYELEQYRKLKERETGEVIFELEQKAQHIVHLYREKLFGAEESFKEARWVFRLHTMSVSKTSYATTGALINWSASKVSGRIRKYQHYLDATRSERMVCQEQFYEDWCRGFSLELELEWYYKTQAAFRHALLVRDPFLEKLGNALTPPNFKRPYHHIFEASALEVLYGHN